MNTTHNPTYYLVNRQMPAHPYVCLAKDLINTSASIFFDNEHQARNAIQAYIDFHLQRGGKVEGVDDTVEETVVDGSRIMEFI